MPMKCYYDSFPRSIKGSFINDVTQIWRFSVTLNFLFHLDLHTKCHKSLNPLPHFRDNIYKQPSSVQMTATFPILLLISCDCSD